MTVRRRLKYSVFEAQRSSDEGQSHEEWRHLGRLKKTAQLARAIPSPIGVTDLGFLFYLRVPSVVNKVVSGIAGPSDDPKTSSNFLTFVRNKKSCKRLCGSRRHFSSQTRIICLMTMRHIMSSSSFRSEHAYAFIFNLPSPFLFRPREYLLRRRRPSWS